MGQYSQVDLNNDIKKVTRLLRQFSPFFYVVPFKVITDEQWETEIGWFQKKPTALASPKYFGFASSFMDTIPENKRLGLLIHEIMHPALLHMGNPWIDKTVPFKLFAKLRNIAQDRVIESSIFFLSATLSPRPDNKELPVEDQTARLICQQHEDEAQLIADRDKSWRQIYEELKAMPNIQQFLDFYKDWIDGHVDFDETADQDKQSQWEAAKEEANTIVGQLRSTEGSTATEFKIEHVAPELSWQHIMANRLQQIPAPMYNSWVRVKRRPFAIHKKYVPVKNGSTNALETVQIWVDTSGSMMHILNKCAAEVKSILKSLDCRKLIMIEYDTSVRRVTEIEFEIDDPEYNVTSFTGLGGTVISNCIKELLEKDELPDASIPMVVLTDGGDDYHVAEYLPDHHITWVCYGGHMSSDMGSVIYAKDVD